MKIRKARAHHIKTNTSKRLQVNLRILAIVYTILLVVTLGVAINSRAAFWQIILGFLIGGVAGLISSRMYKISWHEDEAKVIGKIDIYGLVVLGLFIIFEFNRDHIAELFAPHEAIGAVGLALISGALYGRILGTSRKILAILREVGVI